MIANMFRSEGRPAYKPEDFIPDCFKGTVIKQSIKKMKQILTAAFGEKKRHKRDFLKARKKLKKKGKRNK